MTTTPPENSTSPLGMLFVMTLPTTVFPWPLAIATPMPDSAGVMSATFSGQNLSLWVKTLPAIV